MWQRVDGDGGDDDDDVAGSLYHVYSIWPSNGWVFIVRVYCVKIVNVVWYRAACRTPNNMFYNLQTIADSNNETRGTTAINASSATTYHDISCHLPIMWNKKESK